ncbi:calcium-transporting ATPase 8, plasma membrane-type-like [Cynara cardunculus var. scolymus]|uniref:calcium-transporting ATPase 8, plasma membrane-type-like n=1 Tax=Cynara cardunculus var. scolymus TaxID=59895 RepID=UPI000D624C86|nr:calcium-transporting ATPase 8, plasma membrane-type-like [Cynara cardunculus var. scolymus]XP_024966656.1 calcium-transporting ATPase 8, plasma membrane-type-like [Cynara cardunculus var. scolymus]
MSSGGSPYRRHRKDVESGGSGGFQDYGSVCDPFDIVSTKSASVDRLKRWRQAALVLNASRRFRYTLDLKKEEEKKQIIAKIRTHAQVIRAAYRFQAAAGSEPEGAQKAPPSPIPIGDYNVSPEQLASMTRDHDFSALQNFGGVKGVAEKLKTNPDKGIHDDESKILERKNVFGSNTYPRKKGRSFWRFVFDACRDTTLIILMVAAAASLALGIKTEGIKEGWYDGGSIALAVIIVIVVTAISDYKQSLQFQNLNEEKQNIQLEVMRGGRRVNISIFDIVVGDVIPLKIGDQVPADGILISGHSLAMDESSMTGESKIVHKDHKSPFLMSGCKVADGYGTMLATSVGINTEWGLLMASISEDNGEETPLQVRLNGVATFIGIVGLVVAVFVLVILLIRFFTGHTRDAERRVEFIAGKTSVGDAVDGAIKIFTVAVTIVVVAVPEGLPLAVTLTLAYSMRKMMADKALVRRLSACETMGSATTICSDKTGTLTLNKMTVVEAYICGKKIDPPSSKSELPSRVVSLLIESVAQNTTGSVFLPEGGSDVEISGSPTEKAILQWGVKLGMNFEAVRSESSIIHAFPFNSEKKRGGVAVKLPDNEVHVHWKGAAEIVLAACTRYMDDNEQLVALDEAKVEFFKKAIEDMAAGSLRCVAIAYRPCEGETVPTDEDELAQWELPEGDLVLLAIVGLKDPCRPGVREAVELCVKAGVKVRMVTGDNLQTARAIALECGILASNADATEPNLIEGKSFRALTEGQRLEVADKISVMGRSSPNDKLLLVQALRKRGHVVAVTGDGTNDAPALHEADIGLAMGIQGTEVAKESSDIIILDDNFASVVKVVRWGRSVYANIQKFIQFQLTVNVAALIINVVAAVSSGDVPLNAVQLLWVNLIMDTLGALALATEPPTDHLMDRHPVGRREPLITNIMWRNLLIQAFYQVSVLLVLNFRGRQLLHSEHDPAEHAIKEKNTLIFNAFVLAQVFNEFNARKPDEMNVFKGVTKNRLFMGIVSLTVVLQVLIIMFLGKFTTTVRLSWQLWLVSIVIGIISWPLAVVGKLIPVSEKPFSEYFTDIFASCRRRGNRGGYEDDA